jgi:hypothetical protein
MSDKVKALTALKNSFYYAKGMAKLEPLKGARYSNDFLSELFLGAPGLLSLSDVIDILTGLIEAEINLAKQMENDELL